MKPNDPFYDLQWHLKAMGDLETVWNAYTGKGVKVAVYDGGVDKTHPDLVANYDAGSELVFEGQKIDGSMKDGGAHGTLIAGLIAATGNNGVGMTGVAWGASVTGVNLYDADSPFAFGGEAFFDGIRQMAKFDVVNNSWGGFPDFTEADPAMGDALAHVASAGRGGLGTSVLQACGNDNADMSGEWLATTRYSISVAAMGEDGFAANYSSFGSGVLVTAPTSSAGLRGLYSTDIVGDPGDVEAGPNDGFDGTGNYSPHMGGTSGSTPIVAGTIALMLEANKGLGWRDVQNILSLSSDHAGSAIGSTELGKNENGLWNLTGGGDWNGGGRHFSIDYGYGRINAYSAVRMAEAYKYFAPAAQTSANEIAVGTGTMAIDRTITAKGSFDYTFDVARNVDLEHVDLALKMQFSDFTNIRIYLTSPDGTKAVVYQGADSRVAQAFADEHEYPFGIDSLRGETSKGTWTLTVENVGDVPIEVGKIVSAGFTAYGSEHTANDVYHYTDEFSDMVALSGEGHRQTLADANGGVDWIDAAAVHAASFVDLGAGTARIDGVELTLSGIENVITGDGNDEIIGDAGTNRLVGMRGNDVLAGGQGGDVLDGGAGSDSASYAYAESAVLADLADTSRNFGEAKGDTYVSIENLVGSAHFDILKGNGGANRIDGGEGNDILVGRGGNDVLIGGEGTDLAVYAGDFAAYKLTKGADGRLRVAGEGTDTLDGVETLQFKDGVYDVASGRFVTKAAGLQTVLASTSVDEAFSAADKQIILGVVIEAYQKSDTARAQFDSWIASGREIRFDYGDGRFDAWDGVTTLDLKQLDRASYIDRNGNAVQDYPFTAIIHELGHALRLLPDNQNDDNPPGDNQNYANIIYKDAGYSEQLAYMAYDASGSVIERGRQYTDGMAIDNAWVKKWASLPNDYDVTNGGTKSPLQKDLIIGSGDANVLNSGAGDDFVYGLAGNDRLIGGAGNDRLAGGLGADVLDGGEGSDYASYVHAAAGVTANLADTSVNTGEAAGDTYLSIENIIGSAFGDRLTGDAGANRIEGRDGDDILVGGGGDDVLDGGAGADTAIYLEKFAAYRISAAAGRLTVTGEGRDTLRGVETLQFKDGTYDVASGRFTPTLRMVHSSLSPLLAAGAAYAVLGADDLLAAGGENVTYTVTKLPAGTLLIDGVGASKGASFTQADIEAGRVTILAGAVTPGANGLADSFGYTVRDGDGHAVTGTFSVGYAPFDTVQTEAKWGGYFGGNGDDYQKGTAAADTMTGSGGHDMMVGGDGNDALFGGAGNDRLFGGAGHDMLVGDDGDDLLDGGAGNDQLHGGEGANWILGGAGDDTITSGSGSDRIYGGAGNDSINAGAGDNFVSAGSGNDRVTTGAGNDFVFLGDGRDQVFDNGGNNTIRLGGIAGLASDGDDSFTMGRGADRFALVTTDENGKAAGFGHDTINGFRLAEGDRLVGFGAQAGDFEGEVNLGRLIDAGEVSGQRSADGGDLQLTFTEGGVQSSVTLKWFFWDNAQSLSAAENGTAFGKELDHKALAGILDDVMEDGGTDPFAFLAAAHAHSAHDGLGI